MSAPPPPPLSGWTVTFKDKLKGLNRKADSIETLSHWLSYHKKHSKEATALWASEMLIASSERAVLYLYLANDIMQNAKRKGQSEFVNDFGVQLRRILLPVCQRGDLVLVKEVARLVKIWGERQTLPEPLIRELQAQLRLPSTAPAAGTSGGGQKPPPTLAQLLASLEDAGLVDALAAERAAQLPPIEALAGKGSMPPLPPREVDKAKALLAAQRARLAHELRLRHELIVCLAEACEKQQSQCERFAFAIAECEGIERRIGSSS